MSAMKYVEKLLRDPQGKTLKVVATINNCRLTYIEISGDFFVYPETAIEELERLLYMCSTTICIDRAIEIVSSKAKALGFSWNTLKKVLFEVLSEGCKIERS